LHGRQLLLFRRQGRAGEEVVHVEVPSGMSRELPAWMCDATICGAMSLGAPQVSLSALIELREILTGHCASAALISGPAITSSDCSKQPEKSNEANGPRIQATASAVTPARGRGAIVRGKAREIVAILADLLLEALGKEVAVPASNGGDRDESEDHR
jgi:hypothetical protein